jgi:hypothetical protein
MIRNLHRICLVATMLAIAFGVTPARAGGAEWPSPYFFDDFEDGSVTDDKPVRWVPPEPFEYAKAGTREVIDGDYVITPPDEFPAGSDVRSAASWPKDIYLEDLSIRTQVSRMVPGQNWITLWARGRILNEETSEWADLAAGIRSDGYVVLFMEQGHGQQDSTFTILSDMQTGFTPVNDGVNLQFDVFGDESAVTVWLDGSSKPATPDLHAAIPDLLLEDIMPGNGNLDFGVNSASFDQSDGPAQHVRYFAALPTPWATLVRGDFDENLSIDVADIDLLSQTLRAGSQDLKFDITLDNQVTDLDRQFWIKEVNRTYVGDANLDGLFDSGDLVQVLAAGQYEDGIVANSTWATGDFNGDGEADSADLVAALADGGYEAGPLPAVSAVPEPVWGGTGLLVLVGWAVVSAHRRRV